MPQQAYTVSLALPQSPSVVGIQFELTYDPSVYSLPASQITTLASANSSGKQATCISGPAPGTIQCLLTGLNTNLIPAGALVSVVFNIVNVSSHPSVPQVSNIVMVDATVSTVSVPTAATLTIQ